MEQTSLVATVTENMSVTHSESDHAHAHGGID